MSDIKNKCLTCFDLIAFYEYYNFNSRTVAENQFKLALTSVERKARKDRSLKSLINCYSRDNHKALRDESIEVFWARKEAQYLSLQAAYTAKKLQSKTSIETDEAAMAILDVGSSRKRSYDEEEEEFSCKGARSYVLDFMETNAITIDELKIHKTKKLLSVNERLSLSSITISNDITLPGFKLTKNSYTLIENWRKALFDEKDFFVPQPAPTNRDEMGIANALTSLFLYKQESFRKVGSTKRYKYCQSEIDFIVKFVSVIIQNTIGCSTVLSVDWDTRSSFLMGQASERYSSTRPDILVIGCSGVEVKPPKKCKELIDIDRARIGEICKRQLHLRLQQSSSKKEHCTFGVLVGGTVLELSKLKFDNGKYEYSILKSMVFEEFQEAYDSVEEILECLLSFRKLIEASLPSENENSSSYSFDHYSALLKPTAHFLK